MLESPTGTGKTLCLLTSSLAWREHKLKQAEAAQLALAEQNDLFLDGDITLESLEKNNIAPPRVPVIIYASRTHSQLSQVVAELHRTTYAASLKICVLGSRSQMCIHPIVSQAKGGMTAINRTCTAYVKRQACSYHSHYERYPREAMPKTRDIEDLVAWGRKHEVCPFYTAKAQQETADIIFVPYNYIIDPLIRRSLSVDLQGSVIILDEAHNLETVASDAASFELTSTDLKLCATMIQQYIDMKQDSLISPLLESHLGGKSAPLPIVSEAEAEEAKDGTEEVIEDDVDRITNFEPTPALMKTIITNLLTELASVVFPVGSNAKVGDGKWVYEIFEKLGITNENAHGYLALVDRMAFEISEAQGSYVQTTGPNSVNPYAGANAMSSVSECLRKMFMSGLPASEVSSHFKAVVQRDQSKPGFFAGRRGAPGSNYASLDPSTGDGTAPNISTTTGASSRPANPFDRQWTYKLSLWCFHPGMAMRSLMNTGVRSLIVTSGTLSPLDSFAYELGIPFPLRLENAHVIPTSQIWVGVLPVSVDGEILNSTYTNRSDTYKRSLGRTLINLVRVSPAGMLIFFPSYDMMKECIELWQTSNSTEATIWDQMCRYKQPVVEPRESKQLKFAMKDYYDKVDAPPAGDLKGAIFFAVCRGKVSEGLDFSNQYGRTVVVTGLPLAQNKDQKVKLKREYLDNQAMQRRAASRLPTSSSSSSMPPADAYQSTDKPLSGADWYTQSAWRAVNQAIGRVIRHRNDYGAIIFADERFVSSANTQLSKWLRPHVATIRQPGAAFQGMTKFFAANAEKFPPQPPPMSLLDAPKAIPSSSSPAPSPAVPKTALSVASRLATDNAKRPSVFESLQSAKDAKAAASAAASASNAPAASAAEEKPDLTSKKARAAQVITMAKSKLGSENFKKFQSVLKKFNRKEITRPELLESLQTILNDHPEFMDTLRKYMPSHFAEPAAGTSITPKSASPAPTPPPIAAAPRSTEIPKRSTKAPVAAPSAPAPAVISIRDSSSLEILPPVSNATKKRQNPDPPKAPTPKRFAHAHRNAQEVPGDSLLDTSVTSTDGEVSASQSARATTLPSLELMLPDLPKSPSSSLQIVSDPNSTATASNSIEVINDPFALGEDMNIQPDPPLVLRRSSSDVVSSPAKDPTWYRTLARGNSGGLPADNKNGVSNYSTPKKPQVDLITGQVTSPSMKSPPWIRRSPPKREDSVEIVSIPLPSTSSDVSNQPTDDEGSLQPSSQSAECPICARTQTNFRTAPCGHSCCLDCWNNWLSTKLECPFCRGRVRVKKLEKKPHKKDAV